MLEIRKVARRNKSCSKSEKLLKRYRATSGQPYPSTLIRFQTKTELFCSVFKKRFPSTLIVFVSFSPVHTITPYPFGKRCYTPSAHAQMNLTHAHFNISARKIGAKLKTHGSVCPLHGNVCPPSTLENSDFKSLFSSVDGFQIAPLWRAFFEWLRFR